VTTESSNPAGPAATARAARPVSAAELASAELPCIFARAVLARAAGCGLVRRGSVGERETVGCRAPQAHARCAALAALMRERARFALRLPAPDQPLRHAQAMRIECGGLQGLARTLGAAPADGGDAPLADVNALVDVAQQRHGSLADLAWDGIVGAMRAWAPRRRRPG
jgi:hypothetical protein